MAVRSDTEGFTANRSGSGVSYGGNLLCFVHICHQRLIGLFIASTTRNPDAQRARKQG
jgi:hypothetical protein